MAELKVVFFFPLQYIVKLDIDWTENIRLISYRKLQTFFWECLQPANYCKLFLMIRTCFWTYYVFWETPWPLHRKLLQDRHNSSTGMNTWLTLTRKLHAVFLGETIHMNTVNDYQVSHEKPWKDYICICLLSLLQALSISLRET